MRSNIQTVSYIACMVELEKHFREANEGYIVYVGDKRLRWMTNDAFILAPIRLRHPFPPANPSPMQVSLVEILRWRNDITVPSQHLKDQQSTSTWVSNLPKKPQSRHQTSKSFASAGFVQYTRVKYIQSSLSNPGNRSDAI